MKYYINSQRLSIGEPLILGFENPYMMPSQD